MESGEEHQGESEFTVEGTHWRLTMAVESEGKDSSRNNDAWMHYEQTQRGSFNYGVFDGVGSDSKAAADSASRSTTEQLSQSLKYTGETLTSHGYLQLHRQMLNTCQQELQKHHRGHETTATLLSIQEYSQGGV